MDTQKRLEELRTILRAENMSYDELHELQDLGARGLIEPGDVELLEAAGVPEGQESATDNSKLVEDLVITIAHEDGHKEEVTEIVVGEPGGETVAYANPDNAAELVKRWNAYPELVAALEQMELTFGDTAFAESEAGQDALKQARALLATLNSPA